MRGSCASSRALLGGLLLLIAWPAWAQVSIAPTTARIVDAPALAGYPSRPVRFIVPFPPGGSDTVARIVTQKLSETLAQQFIIDNRPGAASVVGTSLAAKAPSDGYTILFATSAFAMSAVMYDKLPYDPVKDFAPVGAIANAPL